MLILQNLLSNAIKFIRPGTTPDIRVWSERRPATQPADGTSSGTPQAQTMVRLWVEDKGIGIPDQQRQRVFRPFERLRGQDEYPGTGIGLAIIDKAVRRIGRACGVESEHKQGSRFWVELPATKKEA